MVWFAWFRLLLGLLVEVVVGVVGFCWGCWLRFLLGLLVEVVVGVVG